MSGIAQRRRLREAQLLQQAVWVTKGLVDRAVKEGKVKTPDAAAQKKREDDDD